MIYRWVLAGLVGVMVVGCGAAEVEVAADPITFETYDEFQQALDEAVAAGEVDALWDGLKAAGMPLIYGEQVVLLHQADVESVYWGGDWTNWMGEKGTRIEGSDVWMYTIELPTNARVMYQIVVDKGEPMADPYNENRLENGSVIEMPEYAPPSFLDYRGDIAHGTLERDQVISSERLKYDVTYRVYKPADSFVEDPLPTLYVTDGPSYVSYGQMVNALDNLIADGKIQPIVVVFLDPRTTVGRVNIRDEQLLDNPDFGLFIVEELVPYIDSHYLTDPSADARGLVGASFGGNHTAYFMLRHYDMFHLFGIQSPVIPEDIGSTVVSDHKVTDPLPFKKIFLSIGQFEWMGDAEALRDVFEDKGYDMLYMETAEGHHYGNWGGQFDDMLIYFFGEE